MGERAARAGGERPLAGSLALGLGASCLRVLLEPEEVDVAAALATVAAIEGVLDGAGDRAPRLLHALAVIRG